MNNNSRFTQSIVAHSIVVEPYTPRIVLFTFCANRPLPNICQPFATTRRRLPPCPVLRRMHGWRSHRATPLSDPVDFLHWPAPREHPPTPPPVPSATCLAHTISPASSFSSSSLSSLELRGNAPRVPALAHAPLSPTPFSPSQPHASAHLTQNVFTDA